MYNFKVLHIVSGDIWGGSAAQMLFQLSALSSRGHDVQVILLNKKYAYDRYTEAGLNCFVADEGAGFVNVFKQSLCVAKEFKPDIIVSHGYKENILGFLLSLFCICPLITTFHGLIEKYVGKRKYKMVFYSAINSLIWRHWSKRLVTVSEQLAYDRGIRQDKRLRIIRNVIDTSDATMVETKAELFPKRPALLFVGRLVGIKRCDLAIQAVAEIVQNKRLDICLYIAGDGEEKANLESLVDKLRINDHVKFLGFRSNITELMTACDLFITSSESEGIPTVLLDAIYACRPVISTKVGGISEVLNCFPGYPAKLVIPNNYLELAEAIENVHVNHLKVENIQKVRQLFLELFSPARAAREHEAMYQEIISYKHKRE